MKQTLEEAAIKAVENHYGMDYDGKIHEMYILREAFKAGAEWQENQSPWISVKERFPEEQQHVLFISEWRGIHRAYYTGQYRKGKWETEEHIFNTTSFYGTITHWMLIPKFNE